jgi:hypothetical protein
MKSQNLKAHQWKDRLLLVISDSEKDLVFQKQLKGLEQKQIELENRNLVVYQITAEAFKTGFKSQEEWVKSTNLFDSFNPRRKPFKIILIGLDGRIKLEQFEFLSIENLFNTIDSMPMRRAELSAQKKED